MLKRLQELTALVLCCAAPLLHAAPRLPWQCTLDVSPLMGETSSSKSGSSIRSLSSSPTSTSKTLTRNMRWRADVRVRTKARPKTAELRVYYLAYKDDSMKPFILKQEKHPLDLMKEPKASIELTSPTTRLTKSRTRSSSGLRSGGFTKSKSHTRGERIGGCVIQLVTEGKIIRVWVSNPSWEKIAWEDPFTNESLTHKPHNSLN